MSTTIKSRTTTVVLFQGDDLDPIEELRADVQEAAGLADGNRRLGDDPVATAAQHYDEFVDEAVKRAVKVTLNAVGRKEFRALVEKHPPRPDNEVDDGWGFNYETFADSLVPECFEGAISETPENNPDVSSPNKRDAFLDALSDGDWSRLYSAALLLNQGSGPDPKARLSSRVAQTSGAIET